MVATPDPNCPVRRTLDLLQGKWNAYVLYVMSDGEPARFGELKRRIGGITNTMLTSTLRDLEQNGLVLREQFNEVPPHVEYSLTEAGRAFYDVFAAIDAWGKKYL